jgi:hypothetical protein
MKAQQRHWAKGSPGQALGFELGPDLGQFALKVGLNVKLGFYAI